MGSSVSRETQSHDVQAEQRDRGGASPERYLVRLLACWPEAPDRFEELCDHVADWNDLLDCAERHAVLGILHQPLLHLAANLTLPQRRRLEQRRVHERLWARSLEDNLCQALQALRAAQVRTVVLKGPFLAARLYADPSMRFANDLDLLITPADLDRAISALASLGYEAEPESSAWYFRRHHHHLCLNAAHRPTIELHFRAFSGLGIVVESSEVLSGARGFRMHRGNVGEILALEDEVLFLVLHAAGHAFERLSWLFDIKMILRQYPDLNWSRLWQRAQAFRSTQALAFTLHMLSSRWQMELPLPRPFLRRCRNRWRAAELLMSAMQRTADPSSLTTLVKVVFSTLLCDRPHLAAWHLQHHCLRILRRRLHSWCPRLTPRKWAA
jgi:hypothetical protein